MKVLLTVGVALATIANVATAATWDEFGAGSGSLPGLFRYSNFDASVSAAGRQDRWAALGTAPDGRILLTFYTQAENPLSGLNGLVSLAWNGTAWTFPTGSTNGRVFVDTGATLAAKPNVANNSLAIATAFAGTPKNSTLTDAYEGTYTSAAGWSGPGMSLQPGGITDNTLFSQNVFWTGISLNQFGTPYVAISAGQKDKQSIYLRRQVLSTWPGLGGSDVTPIAVGATGTANLYPTIGFSETTPIVTWTERKNSVEKIKVARYNADADAWEPLTATSVTPGLADGRRPLLANKPGSAEFYLGYENIFSKTLTIVRWTGTEFTSAGDPLAPWGFTKVGTLDDRSPSAPEPSVASFAMTVDQEGRPTVVFRAEAPAGSGEYQLFASWYNGTAWEALGNAGSLPRGLSNLDYALTDTVRKPYGNYDPSITMGLDDRPVVSWTFDNGTAENLPVVMVRRFSESVGAEPPTPEEIGDRILGKTESNPALILRLDANADTIVDSADAEKQR